MVPSTQMKIISWNSHLRDGLLLAGDFNSFLHPNEKQGGDIHFSFKVQNFRNFIDALRVHNLDYIGPPFTWNNRRGGKANIRERTDRYLSNSSWFSYYPNSMVRHLEDTCSNHRPIYLSLDDNGTKPKALFFSLMLGGWEIGKLRT